MKYLFFILFFVSLVSNAQDLKVARTQYPQAVESAEITSKLDVTLSAAYFSSDPIILAYKGALLTLKAKFAKSKKEKKDFFKEGVSFIEDAVKISPSNIEIRYIRLTVQENSPKFLGYHKNIEEDKQYILKNFATVSSKELKELIRGFVIKSEKFSESEKAVVKKS